MKEVLILIKKDYLVDFRQKYPIAGIVLYIAAIIYISYLSYGNSINVTMWNAMLWIILLFASVTSIAKSFIQEEDRSLYYYFLTTPSFQLIAKFLYHIIYQVILVVLVWIVFTSFLGNPVSNPLLFIVNYLIGSIGIGCAFVMISAISSKSSNQNVMMPLLGFPIIIPILLLSVSNSKKILLGASIDGIRGNLTTLISVIVIIIALSFILFPYSRRN